MNMFSIWPQFGYQENPYSNQTLPSSDAGDQLLVGRDREVADLQRKIGSGGTHPSVEGPTGVGKSSLIAVAGYRMLLACTNEPRGTLFLPLANFLQLTDDVEQFEERVYLEIAQTLIQNVEAFRLAGLNMPNLSALDAWLNQPTFRQASLGATVLGSGGAVGKGTTPNDGEGFPQSGVPEVIRHELIRLFPTAGSGAIICVLDNLELLQTSGAARTALEAIRDRLINLQGLRWVLCGSRGIVSRARSDRLSGVFDPPVAIGPVADDAAIELIRRRLNFYGASEQPYPPVEPEAFEYLYRALHMNLRDSLAYAQQFSDWMYGEYIATNAELPTSPEDKMSLLQIWLATTSDVAFGAAQRIQRRVWQFFDALTERSGLCAASEWEAFGFTTQQQFSSAITSLVDANLAVRATDPENGSKSLASMTPQGWLVAFHRNRYEV